MSAARTHDVVIFGATGFTGALVVKYFAQSAPKGLRWAIAGRSKAKLEAVLGPLKTPEPIPILIADSSDEASLAELCKSTKVVLTTVGPYAKYGYPLVAACVRAGTHYCDITGEPQYMGKVIETLHDDAVKNKALIVSACGFDSVPGDLGNKLVHETAIQQHPGVKVKHVTSFYTMSGAASGGTLASGINALKDPESKKYRSPYSLTPTKSSATRAPRECYYPKYSNVVKAWSAPFLMALPNVRVVNRSNALSGRQATYSERAGPHGFIAAFLNTLVLAVLGLVMVIPPLRALVSWFLPPGDGPSEKVRENGWFKTRVVAELENGTSVEVMVRSLHGDPGYKETAKMISEAAITLAMDYNKLPLKGGVLTPSVALGDAFQRRLEAAGFEFLAPYDHKTMNKKRA